MQELRTVAVLDALWILHFIKHHIHVDRYEIPMFQKTMIISFLCRCIISWVIANTFLDLTIYEYNGGYLIRRRNAL